MNTHILSFDDNHNIKIDNIYIDIRNNYTISSLKVNKNLNITLNKNKDVIDDNTSTIILTFIEVSDFEVDFELFSSLEIGKLYFDELLAVPLEYMNINLPIKKRPYHSRRIDDGMKFIDSEYILKFEKLDLPIYFKISTKNGIDFYFTAKKFEILI
jgi:hypothetical protein